ncbi:MAG: nitronate monooxygenase [Candidatus Thalassarchaeaceae archaeon]|jgi:nitronate monooxygenase|nr:nitronate monooxygenase [Euryarchaeota archaeon]MDG1547427.1 nitronate monooxygenase [Candidatus Thalassarchaeaceae archaeon]DAC61091.1 MAG TPA: nitronate monooxygenase [Candidatus Poseidoniales archaeon]MBT4475856.1 nitronate monooxygenase [Euryarchaeota archaeon]MDG1554508.1 nitronate monooxygenase [Candidatus Thalassarchaeaceae archaeon]
MINTRLTKDAGIRYPIICGAMYPCSNPELVSAASDGGGIAILQPVSLTMVHGFDKPNRKEGLRAGIRYIRTLTDKPIGFNALIEKGSEKYIRQMSEWIDIALEEGVLFYVTSLGKPDWVCEKVHAKGGVVYHDVTNRKWAEKGKECGVDGLICVNNRAGGHLGELSMEEMYVQLSDMGLPLICAGGVGSELELAKALKIGYDGVQMGTRFIATDECTTPQDYKDAIVKAKEEDITWTTKLTGVPISVINNSKLKKNNSWPIRRLLDSRFKHRIRVLITAISFWRMRAFSKGKGKSSKDLWSAGKSVETVNSIESATVVMERLGKSIDGDIL